MSYFQLLTKIKMGAAKLLTLAQGSVQYFYPANVGTLTRKTYWRVVFYSTDFTSSSKPDPELCRFQIPYPSQKGHN
jgi:hypothetical protein